MLAKILVFLALVGLSASLIQNSLREDELESSLNPRDCPEGMYLNGVSGECENCSKCGQFMYIRKECTKDTNTQCGWCGRKNIVSNKDFMRKCRFPGYYMYSDFREKLRMEFGAEEEDDDSFTDPLTDGFGTVKVVRLQNRPDLGEEDERDLRLASEEDFMNRPVVYRRRIGQAAYDEDEDDEEDDDEYIEQADLNSSEVVEEVHAEEVDEHDIGETPDSKEEKNEFDSIVEEVLADRMAQQKEVLTLVPAQEIQHIPIKFVVTGDIQKDEESDEFDSSESSEEEHEIEEAMEEEEKLYRSNSRMLLRICLMSLIIIIIYVWSSKFMSRRRRHRLLILPDLNNFTDEQKQMIDRCACQLKANEEGHCYENKLAYI